MWGFKFSEVAGSVLLVAAVLLGISALDAMAPREARPAPAPQGISSQLLGEYTAVAVAADTTVTAREILDTSSLSTISGTFATTGTGTFAVNVIWMDTAGNTVATVADVTSAVGDEVGFRLAVLAPRVLVQFEETGDVNPVTVAFGVLLGQSYIGP